MQEAYLEHFLRHMRKKQVLKEFPKDKKEISILDIGCGWNAELLRDLEPHISRGVGIDFKAPDSPSSKITTYKCYLNEGLPFKDDEFEIVTMLAVLEHLDNPMEILSEIQRVLKKDGLLILTTPSWLAKPILEFLAFKLAIVDKDEILDHKRYFNRLDLNSLFNNLESLKIKKHQYFQFGCNNLVVALKI
jgi:ubiquinone/menaquinone biosynthesis C-methylase UbiE